MKYHILLIEDTEVLGEMIRDILLMEGFEVTWASDGKSGLECFNKYPIDLIITDVVMPNMNGLDVVRAIRARIESIQIPIIILSARTSPEDQKAGLQAGASLYLAKPCNNSFLINSIKSLLAI